MTIVEWPSFVEASRMDHTKTAIPTVENQNSYNVGTQWKLMLTELKTNG